MLEKKESVLSKKPDASKERKSSDRPSPSKTQVREAENARAEIAKLATSGKDSKALLSLSRQVQGLIESGALEDSDGKKLSRLILFKEDSSLAGLPTEQLVERTLECLPLLQREHFVMLKQIRYSHGLRENQTSSPLLALMHNIKSRFQFRPDSVSVSQFMTLLTFQDRQKSIDRYKQFRLIRHYDPATIDFIQKQILSSKDVTGNQLVQLLKAYSTLHREQDMMFIYPHVMDELLGALANTLPSLTPPELQSLTRSIGYLQFYSENVERILSFVHGKLRPREDAKLVNHWAEAVCNLQILHKQEAVRDQVVALTQEMQEIVREDTTRGEGQQVATYLSMLKVLCKAQIYDTPLWRTYIDQMRQPLMEQHRSIGRSNVHKIDYINAFLKADQIDEGGPPMSTEFDPTGGNWKTFVSGQFNIINEVEKKLIWRRTHFVKEQQLDGGIYSMDFWLPKEKIAIEVDGPSHFICPTMEPTGTTLAKRRFIANKVKHFFVITGNTVWSEETSVEAVFEKIDTLLYT